MFGFGMSEIVLILVIALLVVGPGKLPELAKTLGKGYAQFKRSLNDLKSAVNIDDLDIVPNKTVKDAYRDHWEKKKQSAESTAESSADVKPEETKTEAAQAEQVTSDTDEVKGKDTNG
ncbi:Sec-independent protein translocase TatA [Geovibrio thiophilus]|uniref:Sec-independent protein translocase TatA n=1 Tax=Geovibrio thiophilus TaxID=139438 RepID=A0A3R5UTH7_9BACT|nr:twin-arginine translocase TatA/TatE family subunit [Geovibrio thiophilus]QAR32063.1 Sec-independent protein translocase TatA [Geovibrio thiophilus]